MDERNILAGFYTEEDATKAARLLKEAGFSTVQVDRIGDYPGEGVEGITNLISGEIPSLGSITLGAAFPSGRDASVLAAASPSASGMADGNPFEQDRSVLLTAVVPESRGDEAVAMIRSCGGDL
ncbi:MAG: hypothetical protein ACM32O_05390 [Clostridia bacterium]